MPQLKQSIKDLFADADAIKIYYPDYNGTEYEDMMVKEAYELLPKITYPNITIEEITNLPTNRFWDGQEFATNLCYQFTINCEQSEEHTANENVQIIQKILDDYIQHDIYSCFRRTGFVPPKPTLEDPNIRMGVIRYDCNYVSSENTIYRRY